MQSSVCADDSVLCGQKGKRCASTLGQCPREPPPPPQNNPDPPPQKAAARRNGYCAQKRRRRARNFCTSHAPVPARTPTHSPHGESHAHTAYRVPARADARLETRSHRTDRPGSCYASRRETADARHLTQAGLAAMTVWLKARGTAAGLGLGHRRLPPTVGWDPPPMAQTTNDQNIHRGMRLNRGR